MKDDPKIERVALFGFGVFFVASFLGLSETEPGLEIFFFPPFSASSSGELQFWLGYALLLAPGGALMGFAVLPRGTALVSSSAALFESLNARRVLAWALFAGFLACVAFHLGQAFILLGLPITDDEYSARFGGRLIASGNRFMPMIEAAGSFPGMFMWLEDGRVTSFDWPGVQLAWALGEFSRTGGLVFSLAGAFAFVALGVAAGLGAGRKYGLLAMLLAASSPMFVALSWTTHAHLLSRAGFACAMAAWLAAAQKDRMGRRWMALFGFSLGVAFLARPPEIVAISLPFVCVLLWEATKGGEGIQRLARAAVAGLIPLLVFLLFNYAITGNPIVPARFAPNEWNDYPGLVTPGMFDFLTNPDVMWSRFGSGVGSNALLLIVWGLGPVGLFFFCFGLTASRFTRLLGLSIASNLMLGLVHDDHGIHAVGPIHYSEAVIPFILISVHGVSRILGAGLGAQIQKFVWASVIGLVFSGAVFHAWHGAALHLQASKQQALYDFVEQAGEEHRALVMAPRLGSLRLSIPVLATPGSWVFSWRPLDPSGARRVEIVLDRPELEPALRRDFPDRVLYRVTQGKSGISVIPVDRPSH